MEPISRCARCILPSSVPKIKFNEDGICNHCLKFENDFKDWDIKSEQKKIELEHIFSKAKSLQRPYDCLIPLSGGKDSTFALYLASKVYKLKTLAITFDNGYLSSLAKKNVENAIASCSADHIYYTINRKNAKNLFKVFLEKTGDFCGACMRGINYTIEINSKAFKIPLIIKGSGRRVQYVSQIENIAGSNTPSFFSNVIKKTDIEDNFNHFALNKFALEIQKITGGILDVFRIPRTTLIRFFPQHIGLYDYVYKPFPEIIKTIKDEMKWDDGAGKSEHLDCELHDIPFYRHSLRLPGTTKNTFYYSGLIRQGIMTREEALKKEVLELQNLKQPDGLKNFLNEIDINLEDYKEFVVNSDISKFDSKFELFIRRIYHKYRKF